MVFHGDQSHGTIRKKITLNNSKLYDVFFLLWFLLIRKSVSLRNIHVFLFQDIFLFKFLRCSNRRIFQAGRCDFVTSLATETSNFSLVSVGVFFADPHMKNIAQESSSRITKHQLGGNKEQNIFETILPEFCVFRKITVLW